MLDTVIQPYLGIHLGFTISQISLIFLVSTIVQGVLTLSLGILADFFNAFNLLIYSFIATDIGILFLIFSHNFLIVLAAVSLAYIGFNVRVPLMRVVIGKRMSKEELSTYFTITPLFSIVLPLLASFIAQESYTIDFVVAVIFIIIVILILFVIKSIVSLTEEKHTTITSHIPFKEYSKLMREDRSELILPLLLAVNRFIFGTSFLYIPLYFTEIIKGSLLELGIMLSTETIAISLASPPSKFVSDRLGNVTTLAMTRILAAITYALLYFIKSPVIFIIVNWVGTLFIAMDNVPEVSLFSKMKTANLSMSLIDSVSTLLAISSPLIALVIWVNISPASVFLLSLLVIIPSAIMFKYKHL
ncbi:MFS transporter [Sulfolobus tengchongensis]|nr:MFS transporter [Saccharolobus shibatae]